MNYGLFILVLFLLVYLFFAIRATVYTHRLKKDRIDWSFEKFRDEFDGVEVENALSIKYAYEDLVGLMRIPIKREDRLELTLGMLPECIEMALEERVQKLGVDNLYCIENMVYSPVRTVEDYVLFLDRVMSIIGSDKNNQ